MKSLFSKKSKKSTTKITEISKSELKNLVGGAETAIGGVKITPDKTTSFFHS